MPGQMDNGLPQVFNDCQLLFSNDACVSFHLLLVTSFFKLLKLDYRSGIASAQKKSHRIRQNLQGYQKTMIFLKCYVQAHTTHRGP